MLPRRMFLMIDWKCIYTPLDLLFDQNLATIKSKTYTWLYMAGRMPLWRGRRMMLNAADPYALEEEGTSQTGGTFRRAPLFLTTPSRLLPRFISSHMGRRGRVVDIVRSPVPDNCFWILQDLGHNPGPCPGGSSCLPPFFEPAELLWERVAVASKQE